MYSSRKRIPLPVLLFGVLAFLSVNAGAQVHRCTDATGKTSFSDVPCPTTAKSAARVLGSDATDRRWENEAYGRERNMQSIESASRIIQAPTSDAIGGAGAGIIDSDPNQRIREQDQRNMQRRMAQIEADRAQQDARDARAAELRLAPSTGPAHLTNCNASGCWDGTGNRYKRTGDGSKFLRSDGKLCRSNGNSLTCN